MYHIATHNLGLGSYVTVQYNDTNRFNTTRLRLINTTKIRPLQGNGMAAISKRLKGWEEERWVNET